MEQEKRANKIFSIRILIAISILCITIQASYPYLGHDYAYFIPRLNDTYLHYKVNGFSIQWYTPSFGGGLPAYPNPQHLQFSLPQLLTLVFPPDIASLIAIAIFSLLGSFSAYYFFHNILGYHWTTSTLGALFFIGNGFYFQHMAVGHLGYQAFPLLPLILVLLLAQSISIKTSSISLAIIFAMLVHSAGFYQIIIFVFSVGITLPLLYLMKPSLFDWKRIILILLCGVGIGLLLSFSKIVAIFSLMRYFPREISDVYSTTLGHKIAGLLLQLLGVMHFLPTASITGWNGEYLQERLSQYTGANYGLWELDSSISPILTMFFVVGILKFLISPKTLTRVRNTKKGEKLAFILLGISLWITIEFIFAQGIFYSFLSGFPILRSLHVNVRFTSSLIFPIVILGTKIYDALTTGWSEGKKDSVSGLLSLLSILSLLVYIFVWKEQGRVFNTSLQDHVYQSIKDGESFPIEKAEYCILEDGFIDGSTSLNPYEPIFGYSLETFDHQLKQGETTQISDGYYNMTNPASLVYPEINQLSLFERVSVDDKANLIRFINHLQPEWKIPLSQRIASIISFATVIILCMLPFYNPAKLLLEKLRQRYF